MSNPHQDGAPPSDQPDPNAHATWDPLVGAGWSPESQPGDAQAGDAQAGDAQPAYGSTGYPPPAYPPVGHPPAVHPQTGYPQSGYPQSGYPRAGYPAPVWLAPVPVYPYAVWIRRVGAYLIDFAPAYAAMIPFYVGYWMFYVPLIRYSFSLPSNPGAEPPSLTGTPLTLMGVGFVLMLGALVWQWYNRWLTAGRTGQSMGKRVLHTKLVAEVNGQPIGPVNAFLRDLLHALDAIAYVGFLWPLWDAKRQTFADMIMKTVVTDLRVSTAPGVPGPDRTGLSQTPAGAA